MEKEYVFALMFLGVAAYNGLRAWWNLRGELHWTGGFKLVNGWNQRVIIGLICVVLCAVALGAAGYMGYQGRLMEQSQAQVAPSMDDQSK